MTTTAWDSVSAVETALDRLAEVSASVEDHLKTFRFLELQGRIEAARANDTEHVRVLFGEIGRQVRAAGDGADGDLGLGGAPRSARRAWGFT